jgi:hypothetical protein
MIHPGGMMRLCGNGRMMGLSDTVVRWDTSIKLKFKRDFMGLSTLYDVPCRKTE